MSVGCRSHHFWLIDRILVIRVDSSSDAPVERLWGYWSINTDKCVAGELSRVGGLVPGKVRGPSIAYKRSESSGEYVATENLVEVEILLIVWRLVEVGILLSG